MLAKYVHDEIKTGMKVTINEQLKELEKRLREGINDLLKEVGVEPRDVASRSLDISYQHFTHHGISKSWSHIKDDKYRYDVMDIIEVKKNGTVIGNVKKDLSAIIGRSRGIRIVVFVTPEDKVASSRACNDRYLERIKQEVKEVGIL